MNTIVTISKTGIPYGKGSDPFKGVKNLLSEEKSAVLEGQTVIVKCPWGDHYSSTEYKKVVSYVDSNGRIRFSHKNYHGNWRIESLTSIERQKLFNPNNLSPDDPTVKVWPKGWID